MDRHDLIVVLCTAPDPTVGAELAKAVLEPGLAACVNIAAIRSLYMWKGELKDDGEVQLIIKTTWGRIEELEAALKKHHPYELPEIIALPVLAASKEYSEWVRETAPR